MFDNSQLKNSFAGPLPQLLQEKRSRSEGVLGKGFCSENHCRAPVSFLFGSSPLNNARNGKCNEGNTLPSAITVKGEVGRTYYGLSTQQTTTWPLKDKLDLCVVTWHEVQHVFISEKSRRTVIVNTFYNNDFTRLRNLSLHFIHICVA